MSAEPRHGDGCTYINLDDLNIVTMNQISSMTYLEQKFICIKWLVVYFPMWIPKIEEKNRNKCLTFIIILFTSIAIIYHVSLLLVLKAIGIFHTSESTVWDIVYFIEQISIQSHVLSHSIISLCISNTI